ncbi:threonine synthase [Tissierella sp. Yu-01]|uniref:threonine synthase n=1 Tax=Tissierella sp. Yu-01 TaxID=3035694 RepID=UPI00240D3B03|nr:threonine synthase [Tissierella sp. Yu-01]WFA08421.1 threonine synthase [Tissierella sp. Yu-01]
MDYISTRNKEIVVTPSQAIIQGISTDGGLFVPVEFPQMSLKRIQELSYKELAYEILRLLLTDFSEKQIKDCIDKAYDEKFDTEGIAPLIQVGDDYFLELYHGPTLAFKDMALSILPHLLKASLNINNIKEEVVILTATSGDTGKAALNGFTNVDGIKIIVFYPESGVSKIQKLQMNTQEGDNTFVVGIKGNFDDAQNGVKELFNNMNFVEKLKENNYILSSANSINIGRLIPQIVYYFHSYIALLGEGKLRIGEKINISVPTGNFGNILAAYYAKKMGLPINKLICASNDNKVLTDFFNTGEYNKIRELHLTTSPSMDILISSNLERLLFHISGEDDELIIELMNQLSKNGYYKMNSTDFKEFYGDYSTEDEVANIINKTFKKYDYLMDTHTAVAYNVSRKYKKDYNDNTKTLVVSTASPYKFASTVASALGIGIEDKDEFEIIDVLSKKSNRSIPEAVKNLKDKTVIHKNSCNTEDMRSIVESFLKVGETHD